MAISTIDPQIQSFKPSFNPKEFPEESPQTQALIEKLNLQPHVEGGYFVETDRDKAKVPNPFTESDETRNASTSILYLLTTRSPLGAFHRNKGRTVHTIHRGRGRYVIIHADEVATTDERGHYAGDAGHDEARLWKGNARIETFIVGTNVLKGERIQWIVDGGKYKSSFLLPDEVDGNTSAGLLISETVVPGFEFKDHDFMREERLDALVPKEKADELRWMLRKPDSIMSQQGEP